VRNVTIPAHAEQSNTAPLSHDADMHGFRRVHDTRSAPYSGECRHSGRDHADSRAPFLLYSLLVETATCSYWRIQWRGL